MRLDLRWGVMGGLALLGAAAPGVAQQVNVLVRLAETPRPAGAVIVSLIDDDRRVVAAGLSDSLGAATLRAPGPGTYRVRAQRVGHPDTTSAPVGLLPRDIVPLTLGVPIRALAPLPVPDLAEGVECGDPGLTTPWLQDAWAQARKVFTAVELTRTTVRVSKVVRRFERRLDANGRVREETDLGTRYTSGRPFTTIAPDRVWHDGFVAHQDTLTLFHALDAQHLLTDGFLAFHCFGWRRGAGPHAGWVGLAFQPLPLRTVPEVAGTIWLEPRENAVREVEFRYTDPEYPKAVPRATGTIAFGAVPGVGWIETGWAIRVTMIEVSGGDRAGGVRFPDRERVIGYVESGGAVDLSTRP